MILRYERNKQEEKKKRNDYYSKDYSSWQHDNETLSTSPVPCLYFFPRSPHHLFDFFFLAAFSLSYWFAAWPSSPWISATNLLYFFS